MGIISKEELEKMPNRPKNWHVVVKLGGGEWKALRLKMTPKQVIQSLMTPADFTYMRLKPARKRSLPLVDLSDV